MVVRLADLTGNTPGNCVRYIEDVDGADVSRRGPRNSNIYRKCRKAPQQATGNRQQATGHYEPELYFVKYLIGNNPHFLQNLTSRQKNTPHSGKDTVNPNKFNVNFDKYTIIAGNPVLDGGESGIDLGKSTPDLGNSASDLGNSALDLGNSGPDLSNSIHHNYKEKE